ncbi:MAG: protein kinase [Bacteroidota bacterium]
MIGKTIAHFTILQKLGEGGMGVVYKAQDTKLDRVVALKFLPEQATATEEEKARFVQEAKAAATLNHSNVCTIHGIEEHEGRQFIEMEYVDGVTLRAKIPENGLKLQDAVDYAIQIAEALQEAHTKGIVHRDVKSENVMLNDKNQIKVMDFGLAKLRGSSRLTKTSSTIGTLAYMAPEQIQGGEVDSRSDIFSFGVLLFEMLTGRSPFRGEHEAALVYSIVNEDPQPIQQFRSDVPETMVHLMNRTLEKDPDDRYQNMNEIVGELRRAKRQSARVSRKVPLEKPAAGVPGVSQVAPTQPMSEGEPPSKPSQKKWFIPAAAAALVVVATALFLVLSGGGPTLNPDMNFRVLQIAHTEIAYPGLSPDGNWIAFPARDANGKWDVYYMNASVGEPRRVTTDSSYRMSLVDVSPDGGQIAYDRRDDASSTMGIYVVSSLGGLSTKLATKGRVPRWRPDGKRIAFMRSGSWAVTERTGDAFEIWSVTPDGQDERLELVDTTIVGFERISFSWSPDGRAVAWLRTFPEKYQEVIIRDLETGEERQLTSDKKNIDEVSWLSNDQVVYSSNRSGHTNLWAVPSSGGEPVQITKGSGPDLGMKASADGRTLLYLQHQLVGNLWIAAVDGSNLRQVTFDERNRSDPSISPDGKRIAFVMADSDPLSSSQHVYVSDRDGTNRRRLTKSDLSPEYTSWSPDGKWISFTGSPTGHDHDSSRVYVVDAQTPGPPRAVGRGWNALWISPDSIIASAVDAGLLTFLDGSPQEPFPVDSALAYPIWNQTSSLIIKWTKTSATWYLGKGHFTDSATFADADQLPIPTVPLVLSPDQKFWYYSKRPGELSRYSLNKGTEERVPGSFPGLRFVGSITSDGKEIIYADRRISAKLVMIEEVFE